MVGVVGVDDDAVLIDGCVAVGVGVVVAVVVVVGGIVCADDAGGLCCCWC